MLSKSLVQKLTQRIDLPLIFPASGNLATELIQAAYASLKLNSTSADTVGCWLAAESPSLPGVVQDETPTRKNRTVLSNRASDFDGINQLFYGGNTSTGKTALSAFAWVRPTTLSSVRGVLAEWNSTGNDRGWLVYFDGTKLIVYITEDGTISSRKVYESVQDFSVNTWYLIGFTFDTSANELLVYVDGKQIAVTKTNDSTLTVIHDTAEDFAIGSYNAGAAYFDGQIQQPLIWESALTAAEVRSLYLRQCDNITAPDYGWFLDADTAHGLTSSSPALTPSNSPDLYESDEIGGGDWLNEKGWNGAAEFNNVDTEITFPSDISLTGDFEISVDLLGAGVNNFIGDDVSGLNFAYSNAATVALRINNNNQTFNFGSGFTSTAFSSVVINRTSGVTTITKDGETAPETLVESGTFMISRLGRERNNWFEGQIKNFKIVDAGTTILDWPLVENSLDVSGNGNNGIDSTNITYAAIPKRWDEELDSLGNGPASSESFGVAKRNGQLEDGACLEFTGTEYATNANLVGTETVTSSGGTSTPTISAGRIDFTAGTCWGLTLSNGSIYPIGEGAGTAAKDVVNDEPLLLVNSPSWGNQSQYFWNEAKGCSAIWDVTSATDAAIGQEIVGAPIEAGVTLSLEIKTTDTRGFLFGNNTIGSPYGIGWTEGSTTTTLLTGMGTPSLLIDGVEFVIGVSTRDDLNTAISTGEWVEIILTNVDLSSFSNGLYFSGYDSATFFWDGQVRNLVINGEPFDGPLLIPALADGSGNDANGYPLTNPAGPYLKGSAKLDLKPVANSSSASPLYYAAEGDGVGYLTLDDEITLSGAFEISFTAYSADFNQNGMILGGSSGGTVSKIGFLTSAGGVVFVRVVNGGSGDSTVGLPAAGEHVFVLTRNSSDIVTLSIDGTNYTLFSGAAQTGDMVLDQVFADQTQIFTGTIRNLKIIDDGTTVLDLPLYKDALDRSPSCNHGTVTVAGVSFLSETPSSTLEPPITNTNTMTANTDRQIVQIGQR